MKIETIKKYISLMESMLDSDATSLQDYCTKTGLSYGTFNIQLNAIKKQVSSYYKECSYAIQLWEDVKKHFKENRNKCKSPNEIKTLALSNLQEWNGIEDVDSFNNRVKIEIARLEKLLISEEKLELTPERVEAFDENYWDTL